MIYNVYVKAFMTWFMVNNGTYDYNLLLAKHNYYCVQWDGECIFHHK